MSVTRPSVPPKVFIPTFHVVAESSDVTLACTPRLHDVAVAFLTGAWGKATERDSAMLNSVPGGAGFGGD